MAIPAVGRGCAGPRRQLSFVPIRVAVAALAKREPLVLHRPRTEWTVAALAFDVAVQALQRKPGRVVEVFSIPSDGLTTSQPFSLWQSAQLFPKAPRCGSRWQLAQLPCAIGLYRAKAAARGLGNPVGSAPSATCGWHSAQASGWCFPRSGKSVRA